MRAGTTSMTCSQCGAGFQDFGVSLVLSFPGAGLHIMHACVLLWRFTGTHLSTTECSGASLANTSVTRMSPMLRGARPARSISLYIFPIIVTSFGFAWLIACAHLLVVAPVLHWLAFR